MSLSSTQRAMLEFERRWWTEPGPKDARLREEFGLSPAEYAQHLHDLIDRPDALEADPLLVRRLRRQREQRVQDRSERHRSRPGAIS
jgi:Protein of unknown function (DUF3263)